MLTNEDIKEDLARYDRRITRLKCDLMDLKPGSKGQRRKYYQKRDQLEKKILHISGLRQMAIDCLAGKFEPNALTKDR